MTHTNNAKGIYTKAMAAFVEEKYDDAIRFFDAAIAEDGAFSLAFVSRGAAQLNQRRPTEAIVDFNKAIGIDGNSGCERYRQ